MLLFLVLLAAVSSKVWHETGNLNNTAERVETEVKCVTVLAGQKMRFSTCCPDKDGSWSDGDTYLYLSKGENISNEVTQDDDGCGTLLSELTYTADTDGEYCLHMGCFPESGECSMSVTYTIDAAEPERCVFEYHEEFYQDVDFDQVENSGFCENPDAYSGHKIIDLAPFFEQYFSSNYSYSAYSFTEEQYMYRCDWLMWDGSYYSDGYYDDSTSNYSAGYDWYYDSHPLCYFGNIVDSCCEDQQSICNHSNTVFSDDCLDLVDYPGWLGDGYCDELPYFSEDCQWDGGDCDIVEECDADVCLGLYHTNDCSSWYRPVAVTIADGGALDECRVSPGHLDRDGDGDDYYIVACLDGGSAQLTFYNDQECILEEDRCTIHNDLATCSQCNGRSVIAKFNCLSPDDQSPDDQSPDDQYPSLNIGSTLSVSSGMLAVLALALELLVLCN